MKLSILIGAAVLFLCQIVLGQENSSKKFAIYLLPENIKPAQLSKLNLKNLKPIGKPFIAAENIETYEKETHEFQVDYIVAEKLKNLKVSGGGKSFAVFVGNEAIYTGAFWTSISSQSFDGIVVNYTKYPEYSPFYSNPDFPFLSFELGYPSPKWFKGADARSDSRIFEALEKDGLLYEKLEILATCKKITGTGKRHPSYIFTFSIDSIVNGKFEKPEITLELFNDFGGAKMREALDSFNTPYDNENGWQFNKEKKILLKFIKQVAPANPKLLLKGFEVK